MPEDAPSIAIVDDDPAVVRSLLRLLRAHGFDAKGYTSSESLLSELGALSPDCIVADLAMPDTTGLELQEALAGLDWYPIVFVTGNGDIQSSVQAMRAGAVDFLTKPVEQYSLLAAVQRAVTASRSAREFRGRRDVLRNRADSLTPREREVFEQVVLGFMNKQIAAHLGITEKTVKVHRARVMQKMQVKSLAQLVRVAEQIEMADGLMVPRYPISRGDAGAIQQG